MKGIMENAKTFATMGFKVFPLMPNTKKPATRNGFNDATNDIQQIKKWWSEIPDANYGIWTEKIFVVDLDVKDGKNGIENFQQLCPGQELPDTVTVSTPSGGLHLYFKTPKGTDIKCSAGKIGEGIDIRGNSGYIVGPSSLINGNTYEMVKKTKISEAPDWLLRLLTDQKSATQPNKQGFVKGYRNDSIFKLACSLRSQGTSYEIAQDAILVSAANCAPPLSHDEALRTLNSAYERYPEGNGIPEEIIRINKDYFATRMSGKFVIGREYIDPVFKRKDIEFMSATTFSSFFSNKYISLESENKKDKKPLGQYWLSHPHRREYEGMIFSPMCVYPGYFNLWKGFGCESKEGDCSLFLKHIKEVISDNSEILYNYVLSWLANLIQTPGHRPGTAIVLRGKQGTGKGKFCHEVGKLLGSHFLYINRADSLLGNFNSHLESAILVFADEAFWAGNKKAEGVLKGTITDDLNQIERKGCDSYQAMNYIHLMMASNEEWVVPAGMEERRFLVLDVSDKYQQNCSYFEDISNQMENGGREALLHYLMNYKYDKLKLRNIPKTKALLSNKLESLDMMGRFVYNLLSEGVLNNALKDEWEEHIETDKLYEIFSNFCKSSHKRHVPTSVEFGKKLHNYIDGVEKKRTVINGKRRNIYYFPPLDDCRKSFEKKLGQDIDWDDS